MGEEGQGGGACAPRGASACAPVHQHQQLNTCAPVHAQAVHAPVSGVLRCCAAGHPDSHAARVARDATRADVCCGALQPSCAVMALV